MSDKGATDKTRARKHPNFDFSTRARTPRLYGNINLPDYRKVVNQADPATGLPWEKAASILDLYLTEYTGAPLADYGPGPDLTGYSGAEIKQIAIEAAYNGGDLAAAAGFVIPLSKTNKDALDALTKWAAGRTIPAHLPGAPATGRKLEVNK